MCLVPLHLFELGFVVKQLLREENHIGNESEQDAYHLLEIQYLPSYKQSFYFSDCGQIWNDSLDDEEVKQLF